MEFLPACQFRRGIYIYKPGLISTDHFIEGKIWHNLSRCMRMQFIKMTDMTDLDRTNNLDSPVAVVITLPHLTM